MKKAYCGYCEDGPYSREYIGVGDGHIGGIIDGYWFCSWCLELGYGEYEESERWDKLTEEAKNNNVPKVVHID